MGDFTKSISKLIPIYGTYLKGKQFINNPSWKGVKELALPISRDAALLTGGITGLSTGLVTGNSAVKAYKSAKVLNSLGKSLASKIRGNAKPTTETPLKTVKLKNGRVVNKMSDGYWYWADTGKRVAETEFASPKPTTTPDGKPAGLPKKTNIFIKGFEHRQNEIENLGGVSAVQNLLEKQGYNIGKYGADGKWGSDTEAAYKEYLENQNLKNLGQQPLAKSAYNNINITQPNIRNAQDWRSNLLNTLSLSYRKKGGTLSSRNPITRFKANFRLVAQ